jgi:hypothetical protein
VVEASLSRSRAFLAPTVALLALGLLAAMVSSGRIRENRQLVKPSVAGVMPESPVEIDRVELRATTGRWIFVRAPQGWRVGLEGRPVAASLALHLDDAIKFMHVSAPIRVMERAEWEPVGLREFGLDPPGYTATLYRRDTLVVGAEFGTANPQKVLQYMKLRGRDEVYLISRFVGQEWEQTLREASGQ